MMLDVILWDIGTHSHPDTLISTLVFTLPNTRAMMHDLLVPSTLATVSWTLPETRF